MRPPENEKIWRKQLRREAKGVRKGRRSTHKTETQPMYRRSTWLRRHQWMPEAIQTWREKAQ